MDREHYLLSLNGGIPEGLELTNGSGAYVLVVRQKDNTGTIGLVRQVRHRAVTQIQPSPLEALRLPRLRRRSTNLQRVLSESSRARSPGFGKCAAKEMLMELAALNPSPRSSDECNGLALGPMIFLNVD